MRLRRRAEPPDASSTAVSTACSSCWRTRARISTISRSPPGVLSMRCCRARKAGGSSTKGAPLRKCARFALNDRQIVPPVENGGCAFAFVGAGKNAAMFADDLSLGDDDDAFGIHPHADWTIGEGGRHAIAIAVQMDQARRRHALGVFDEAVERARRLHQMLDLFGPGVGNRARMRGVRRLLPQLPASHLQPVVQRRSYAGFWVTALIKRRTFLGSMISLKTMSRAVSCESAPFMRTVRWRTVAKARLRFRRGILHRGRSSATDFVLAGAASFSPPPRRSASGIRSQQWN